MDTLQWYFIVWLMLTMVGLVLFVLDLVFITGEGYTAILYFVSSFGEIDS